MASSPNGINELRQALENVIQSTSVQTASGSWSNGDDFTFTITTTSSSGAKCITQQDITIYQDSVASANSFAGGATPPDLTKWVVFGPINDYDSTNGINSVTKIRIVNVSAGTHTLIIKVQSRILQNSITLGGTLS